MSVPTAGFPDPPIREFDFVLPSDVAGGFAASISQAVGE
jgi:hypothetical protein